VFADVQFKEEIVVGISYKPFREEQITSNDEKIF